MGSCGGRLEDREATVREAVGEREAAGTTPWQAQLELEGYGPSVTDGHGGWGGPLPPPSRAGGADSLSSDACPRGSQ